MLHVHLVLHTWHRLDITQCMAYTENGLNNAHHVLQCTRDFIRNTQFQRNTGDKTRRHSWAFIWKSYSGKGAQVLLVFCAIKLPVKALSWRAVSESFENFQPTSSRKTLDSVLDSEQLHRDACCISSYHPCLDTAWHCHPYFLLQYFVIVFILVTAIFFKF